MKAIWKPFSSLLLVTFLVSGCASISPSPVAHDSLPPAPTAPTETTLAGEITQADQDIEEKPTSKVETTDISEHPQMLVDLNARVEKWITIFSGSNRESFGRFLTRGARYRALVERTLEEEGIPKEFYYLAMIESGYSTRATSSAKAVGIWQFIRGTGTRYGLKTDQTVDERRDPVRATRAAAGYLRDLYNVFGSWRLAMAAYNCGERRILTAIMKGKTRDFWTLAEKRVLPRETMDYVPKFFAAVIIGNNPEKYGFDVDAEIEPWEVTQVVVPSPIRLGTVSEKAQIPVSELKASNPHLLRDMTPGGSGRYALSVPKELAARVESVADQLTPMKAAAPSRPLVARKEKLASKGPLKALVYRVRPGDTLKRISSHFGVPIRQLRKLNKLRSSSIFSGQSLKIRTGYL